MTENTSNVCDGHILEREPTSVEPHVTASARQVEDALAKTQRKIVSRLFPDPADRVVREHELDQLHTGFEFRRRTLRMAVDTKLQAIEEMCNHVLVTGKSEIRRQRQEFFADQKLTLQAAMDQCAERFNEDIDKRFQNLTRYKNDYLRQKEEERLFKSVDQFHAMLDQLGAEFLDIIHEGVSR